MKHPKCRNRKSINSKCVPSSNRKSGSGSEARLCMQRPPSVRRPQSCALSSSSKVCCCCLLAAVLILVLPFFPLLLLLLLLLLISDLAASAQLHPMPLRPSEHQVLSRVCKLLIFSDCTFILFFTFCQDVSLDWRYAHYFGANVFLPLDYEVRYTKYVFLPPDYIVRYIKGMLKNWIGDFWGFLELDLAFSHHHYQCTDSFSQHCSIAGAGSWFPPTLPCNQLEVNLSSLNPRSSSLRCFWVFECLNR